MTPAILTNTNRFGEALIEYQAHWAVVMNEQDAQLINPAGDLAATFVDPAFALEVCNMLNTPVEVEKAAEIAAIEGAADVHELLEAANEVVERQNAEIAALRKRHVRMLRYLNLLVAVALDSQRANTTSANDGSSVAPVSVPAAANCDAPVAADAPPIAATGIDLSTDVSLDGTDGTDGTHEAEVPA